MPLSFAMFANLTSSKAIDLISSGVKFIKRDPHFCSEISSFSERIFLEFL
jgi:hypothetical protein